MAFTPNINDAFERTRNRNSFIPSDNISFSFFDAGLRPTSLRESAQQSSTDPARGSLQRRFTTNTVPLIQNVLSPIGQPRRQAMEASVGPDYSIAVSAAFFAVTIVRGSIEQPPLFSSLRCKIPMFAIHFATFPSLIVRVRLIRACSL